MQRDLVVMVILAFVLAAPLNAEDWAQWRGSDRLGIWTESGILESFPEDGLRVKWRAPVRSGFSGPSVADGRVFLLDWQEDPLSRTMDGTERIVAFDEQTGELLWAHEWETTYRMLWLRMLSVRGRHRRLTGTVFMPLARREDCSVSTSRSVM